MFGKWRTGAPAATARASSNGSTPDHAQLRTSIISEGLHVEGDLTAAEGLLHVNGSVHGAVRATSVIIGPAGRLDGSIEATSVTIRGVMNGTVDCQELVIDAAARVSGHMRYSRLQVHGGARVDAVLVRTAEQRSERSLA
jgi:cytoskeletal protein CcmA (bactofilin family)